jgi:hypothetical protein
VFSLDEHRSLRVGDVVETLPLMPGLDAEPLKIEVVERDVRGDLTFKVTWFDIRIGTWTCAERDGCLVWGGLPP